ncbi:phosphotransferase family protein [Candidatus Hydrogenedentota bacterium]
MQFDRKKLERILEEKMGLTPDCLEIAVIREGYFSNSYKVSGNGDDYYLRIAPPDDYLCIFYEKRMTLQEPEVHQLILDNTSVPVPRILVHDSTRELLDRDYVIMEFLPGQTLEHWQPRYSRKQHDNCLRQWGNHIRQLHGITRDTHGYLGAHKPMEPQTTWREAFSIMWGKMVCDCLDCGCYTPDQAKVAVELLRRYENVFSDTIPASLMHMDVWITNVLLDGQGNVTGLIDFDRACWGDPEIELSIVSYCGLARPSFWEGYGVAPGQSTEARIRFHFYTMYEHQKYIVICMSQRRNNPSGARRYAADSLDMMEQLRRL